MKRGKYIRSLECNYKNRLSHIGKIHTEESKQKDRESLIMLRDKKIDIEFDGHYWHKERNTQEKDDLRDKVLTLLGWKVIRYNDEILSLLKEAVK